MTPEAAVAGRAMSEKALMECIVKAARTLGYLVHHETDSRLSEPGYPDLTIVHPHGGPVFFWELKTAKGKARPASVTKQGRWLPGQMDWLDALRHADGTDARLIRPDDLDEALAILRIGYEQGSKA